MQVRTGLVPSVVSATSPHTPSGGFKPSPLPAIAATGMQGFLKWFQREQPALYQKLAPQIAAGAPQVFSDYNQSLVQGVRARGARASMIRRNGGMRGLGDDFTDSFSDPTIDVDSLTSNLTPITVDTSDAANSGAGTSSSTTSWLASLIGAGTAAFTTVSQQNTANQITQLQLQRAQQGLAPLNIGMGANGIPTITGVAGGATVLLLAGGALLLFMMMGRGKKA